MDEEVDPDDENVNTVLAQESSELLMILSSQSPTVITKLGQMMPDDARWNIHHPAPSAEALTEHIKAMLKHFTEANAAECCNFLQSMCMWCENMPMRLESRLMSVAGYANNACENSIPGVTDEKPSSAASDQQLVKRPRIDYWEQYISTVKSLQVKRWEQLSDRSPVKEVPLENVWVSLRTLTRSREKPDQTPGSAGSKTPANLEPDGDYGSLESRVTLETFLQGCAGKVTVLIGQSGSGKTLLMSSLGQQWARELGPVPSSSLFVLLEFRQLSLVSRPLSLFELLFRHYLPPEDGDDEKRAIVDYLLSNPEQSCWVLDGYDEFNSKVLKQEVQKGLLNFEIRLPVAELISGLLNRQLLPGCTLVVTCRARNVFLEAISDKVGQLVGWDCHDIKEYVHNFFGVKGPTANQALGMRAADLLLSSQHLLAMSSLPALCNMCCICLDHLLLEGRDTERTQVPEQGGIETRTKTREKDETGAQMSGERKGEDGSRGGNYARRGDQGGRTENENLTLDVKNAGSQQCPIQVQIPPTVTHVYLTVLVAFLSRDPDKRGRTDMAKSMTLQQSTVLMLSQYQSELCELSQLAWKGLEDNKILFMEEEISHALLTFSIRTGLFSKFILAIFKRAHHEKSGTPEGLCGLENVTGASINIVVELRREDGKLVNSYCFAPLTIQEFLAALRIMTSQDVSETQLKKRFSLKTRWTTKLDQRTVFTDSLHLFVCGLASPECTAALVQVARTSSGTGAQNWVPKRQALVLKLLKTLCQSNTLTGPKMLELCHCVQESQNHQLAQVVVDTRPTLELRNIWLSPNDIHALAFVANSVGDKGIGLDFGACSMELECLDVLPKCPYIHYLCFRSRKYGDKFAEKLSSILPKLTALRKLEFCGASLTATGAASLASALQNCPDITELNLSDNNLKDAGIEHIANVFTKLPRLVTVMLGRNNSSLEAMDCLIRKISSCLNIQHIHADGIKELNVTFSRISDLTSHKTKSEPSISLLNQKWSEGEMQKLAGSLARCPTLSVLDLSGGQWDLETLRTLTKFLPRFNVTKKILINDSCSSVEALVTLTALLSDCPALTELHIRLQNPVQVSIVFSGGREEPVDKKLCLSCCGLRPADLERVWRSMGDSPDLTFLDLSNNRLGNKGLRNLLDFLPRLSSIKEINASNNDISMDGVVMLAGALCSNNNLTQIHVSHEGRKQVTLTFCPDESDDKQQFKTFRINNSSLMPSNVTALCRRLVQCRSSLELDLSYSSLKDEAFENLLKGLPKMASLQKLNVSHCITSTAGALTLVSCLSVSERVTSVEIRPETESLIHFDSDEAKHASCRLTHFNLSGDSLERLLKILQQGPHLSYLDLSSNQLEDKGVKRFLDSLLELKITSFVNLSNNNLTQQGLLDVAGTLCTCGKVCRVEVSLGAEERCLIWFTQHEGCEKTLSIRDSSLENEHLVRLAEVVSLCPSLTKLELKNNLRHSEWIVDFVELLNGYERGLSVSIEEPWIRSEKAISLLCQCLVHVGNIHTIRVHRTTLHLFLRKSVELTSLSDDSADLTSSLATEKIGLVDCALEGHQLVSMMSVIQKCPLLTELDLSHNSLGRKGAEFICSVLPLLPNLTSVRIGSKESFVGEKLSEALLHSTAIQCLNLSGHVIFDTAAQIMTRMLPRLRSLNLSHCVWSADGGLQLIKALGDCASLESLCLDSLKLDEESRECLAQSLKNINSIRSLKLNKISIPTDQSGANSVLDLLAAMEGLTRMEEIELEGWRMADGGIEQLTRILPRWTELRRIRCVSVEKHCSLLFGWREPELPESSRHLHFDGRFLFRQCFSLEEICLQKNLISDQSGDKLVEALRSCSHLEELNVSSNNLSDLTAARMALVLPSLTHITVLDISENRIEYEGSVSLSRAITCMKNLTKLYLTSVGTSELCAVAASLAHCPLIQDVGLGWNNCGDKVAVELARVMPHCQKLTKIDLESNVVTVLGAEALLRALHSCPALQLIRLWRNQVSSSEADRLSLKDRRLNFSST